MKDDTRVRAVQYCMAILLQIYHRPLHLFEHQHVLQAGALLAAEQSKNDLPEEWLEQVKRLDEYQELVEKLVSQRAIISILPP